MLMTMAADRPPVEHHGGPAENPEATCRLGTGTMDWQGCRDSRGPQHITTAGQAIYLDGQLIALSPIGMVRW